MPELSEMQTPVPAKPKVLVIGVGNSYRSDDAVGLVVARRLREKASGQVKILEVGEAMALLEEWKDADKVVLIDAIYSSAKPGTIYRFDAQVGHIPSQYFRYSTHVFSVADVIELSRALNQLPMRLIAYGIVGESFEAGVSLSPKVESIIDEVVERVLLELKNK